MNASSFTHMVGQVLTLLLMFGTGFNAGAQHVDVAELDGTIARLNEADGEELRSLYYDSKASVFLRPDKPEPIEVGKGQTKVVHVDATRLTELSDVNGPFVSMVVVDCTGAEANDSYALSAHDLANFPLLKFIVFVAYDEIQAKQLAANTIKGLTQHQPYIVLYKSLTQAN